LTRRADLLQGLPVLVAAFVGTGTGVLTIVNQSIGVLTPSLQANYGWGRGEISSLLGVTTIALAFTGLLSGWLIDRIGLRPILAVSIPLYAASQVLMSFESIHHGDINVMRMLYFLGGTVGAGTATIVYARAIAGRFTTARGIALGISALGGSLIAILIPIALGAMLPTVGLQGAYLAFAGMALIPLPFALLFFTSKNEVKTASMTPALTGRARWSVLTSSTFWKLSLSFFLIAMTTSALSAHAIPALVDRGNTLIQAAALVAAVGVGGIIGRLLSGFLLDRFQASRVGFFIFMTAVPGFPALIFAPEWLVVVALFMLGVVAGSEIDTLAYLISRHFDVTNFAFTSSLIFIFFVLGGGLGATLAGLAYDAAGNYTSVSIAVAVLIFISAAILLTLPKYRTFEQDAENLEADVAQL
jgi:MFS family permease